MAFGIGCLALLIGRLAAPKCPGGSGQREDAPTNASIASEALADVEAQRARSPWRRQAIRLSIATLLVVPPAADAAVPELIGALSAGKAVPIVYAMHVATAVALGTVYLSSLVDWFYVQPRLKGLCGHLMPCQSSASREWRSVTKIWLLHRLAAMLAFVIGLTVVVALGAHRWITGIDDALATAIGAAATILAGFYLTRSPATLALAIRPAIHVGDTVRVAEPFNYPDVAGRYYVVDIALEGVRLLRLDEDDRIHPHSAASLPGGSEHDRLLDLADASKLVRERGALAPCDPPALCRRVNAECLYRSHFQQPPANSA